MATIEDLLKALAITSVIDANNRKLPNTRETWARIGNKDLFQELGLSTSDLSSFLQTWMEENPYSSIS